MYYELEYLPNLSIIDIENLTIVDFHTTSREFFKHSVVVSGVVASDMTDLVKSISQRVNGIEDCWNIPCE